MNARLQIQVGDYEGPDRRRCLCWMSVRGAGSLASSGRNNAEGLPGAPILQMACAFPLGHSGPHDYKRPYDSRQYERDCPRRRKGEA